MATEPIPPSPGVPAVDVAPTPAVVAPSAIDDTRSSNEIKADIERTQARIASTVDALKDKLTPGGILSEARQSVAGSALRAVGQASVNRRPAAIFFGVLGAVLVFGYFCRRRDADEELSRLVDEAYDEGDEFDIDWLEQYP